MSMGGPGCYSGVGDVVDGRTRACWSEVVGQFYTGVGEQAPAMGRAGPGRLRVRQRCAREGGEADLGVDLDDVAFGVSDPGVDLEQFGAQRKGLSGHLGAGQSPVDRDGRGVIRGQ